MKKIYKIEGMHCASCAMNIEKSVRKLKNVKSTSVNFAVKKLYVDSDKEINDEEIKKAVSSIGDYKAISDNQEEIGKRELSKNESSDAKTTTFIIPGLDNPHCAMTIENALNKVEV